MRFYGIRGRRVLRSLPLKRTSTERLKSRSCPALPRPCEAQPSAVRRARAAPAFCARTRGWQWPSILPPGAPPPPESRQLPGTESAFSVAFFSKHWHSSLKWLMNILWCDRHHAVFPGEGKQNPAACSLRFPYLAIDPGDSYHPCVWDGPFLNCCNTYHQQCIACFIIQRRSLKIQPRQFSARSWHRLVRVVLRAIHKRSQVWKPLI